jgi:hypothetical protein
VVCRAVDRVVVGNAIRQRRRGGGGDGGKKGEGKGGKGGRKGKQKQQQQQQQQERAASTASCNAFCIVRPPGHHAGRDGATIGCVGRLRAAWRLPAACFGACSLSRLPLSLSLSLSPSLSPSLALSQSLPAAAPAKAARAPVAAALLPAGWVARISRAAGMLYYVHEERKLSQWDQPVVEESG